MPQEIELVACAGEVSVQWLDTVLSGAGCARGGRLESIEATPVGTGKVGEIVRFTLGWRNDSDGPASVIGKFASSDATSRRAGLVTRTYVREVSFYRRLAHTVALRIPRCYGVAFDENSGNFALILDDLTPARPGDQLAGCSVPEACDALQALAGLHAPHYASGALRRESWLGLRGPDAADGLASIYDALVDGFAARFGERLDTDVIDAALRLRGRVRAWLAHDTEPFTLLHGDYRVENMLFGAPGAGFTLAVVDWQTVTIGPGMSDVAYFMGAGLSVEERRKHEVDLVRLYRDAMHSRGIELDLNRCWNEYRMHAFAGLHMAVVASQLVARDPRSDAMFCTMAERHAAQIYDLESFELIGATRR